MHKLLRYVCDELEKIEQQASSGKLSMSEIEYADKLAHLKKNILRADELMDQGYSGESSGMGGRMYSDPFFRGSSYENRGRGSDAQRDSRGRYSGRYSGRGYSREGGYSGEGRGYSREGRGYSGDSKEVVEDLRDIMEQAPSASMRQQIKAIIEKVEEMDD